MESIERMVSVINLHPELLTEWEQEFMESINGAIAKDWSLTEKQINVLDKIFQRIQHKDTFNADKEMLKEIMEGATDDCTDWEVEFLESIQGKLSKGYLLTDKQKEALQKIHSKYVQGEPDAWGRTQ